MNSDSINRREIYRYLGYRNVLPDKDIDMLIEEVIKDSIKVVSPKYISKRCRLSLMENKISIYDEDKLCMELNSKNLCDNLSTCDEVILFAATLGVEADSYIKRLSIINMAKAGIAQAVFGAMIEAYCNEKQQEISKLVEEEGFYLKPRFSPGYGDLALEVQRDFFKAMEITKRIGITLTDSCLMVPTKSVTAFIGLTRNKNICHINKCKNCENKECEFRDENAER